MTGSIVTVHRLIALITRYGMPLVWLNVFLEQLGAPIPAVPTLVIAGALSRDGKMSSTSIIAGSVVASLVADFLWFYLGRRSGFRVLKVLCRISLSPDSCVRETEARFERWGMPSLLFAKFIPGFSTIAPPLAGAAGGSVLQFLAYDTAGAFIWAGAAVAAGRVFHRAIDRVLTALENLGWWAVVLVSAALALVIILKWVQRRRFILQLRLARITSREVNDMLTRGEEPMIFDVRSAAAQLRDPRRLPKARVMPRDTLVEHLTDVPRDRQIILYCT